MSDEHPDWQDGDLKVVVNDEGQYSIWPIDREPPLGWREVGKTGNKQECLEWIKNTWTDMRPLSLQQDMTKNQDKKQDA